MEQQEFIDRKQRVLTRNRPSCGAQLAELLIDFDAGLEASGLFEAVLVRSTGDLECMLVASCSPGSTQRPVVELAAATQRAWHGCLCESLAAFHALTATDDEVILDFVAQSRITGQFVTGRVIVACDSQLASDAGPQRCSAAPELTPSGAS